MSNAALEIVSFSAMESITYLLTECGKVTDGEKNDIGIFTLQREKQESAPHLLIEKSIYKN